MVSRNMIRLWLLLLLVGTFCSFPQATETAEHDAALALKPDIENGKEVFEICAACHEPGGNGSSDGYFPRIAGQYREVVIKQLADIRAKNRDNPTMYPFALAESIGGAQAIADVAAYIESLPVSGETGQGPFASGSNEYLAGEKLYQSDCAQCHGDSGQGKRSMEYPKLAGQHYAYMIRQFEWIRDGKRRNADPDMANLIANYSESDMQAVINYVSRLPAD